MNCSKINSRNSINFGIPGFQKTYSQAGKKFNIKLSTSGSVARRIELLKIGERRGLKIVVNNAKCKADLLRNSKRKLEKVELLGAPFDKSLKSYFKMDFPPAAVFYNMANGTIDELNRVIELLGENQILNSPLVIYGDENQREYVKEYKPLDFFTRVTDSALTRKISNIYQEWIDKIAALDQFMNGAWGSLLLLQERDNYTGIHSHSVALLAYLIGEKLELTPMELEILKIGGIFHDLGKMGIRDEILNKPGALSDDEYVQMQQHPDKGVGVVSFFTAGFGEKLRQSVLEMVKYHHRRYDNRGYPDIEEGLGELSLLTFVASGADSLDAMTTERVYKKKGFALTEKKEDIRGNRGKQFHPAVADACLELLEEGISVEAQMPIPSTNILKIRELSSLN